MDARTKILSVQICVSVLTVIMRTPVNVEMLKGSRQLNNQTHDLDICTLDFTNFLLWLS